MSLPVITFMGFASLVEFDILIVLLEIIDNGCHCRSLIAVRHQRGFSLRLGDQASKDVVELFLSEKRGHGGDAENLVFVGVVPGSCYGCDDGILVCVLAVGAALDQLVAGPLFTADGCLKRIVLDVGGPSDQLVDATEDFFDLFICQQRRLPELELGKLHVGVGSFTAVSFGLAELAPFAAVVFTVSVKGKLCSRGQNLIGPLVEFVLWNGEGADVKLHIGQARTYITVPAEQARRLIDGGYVGKTVVMGIRPEDIHDEESFIEMSPESVFTTTIRLYELLGAEVYLYFDVEGFDCTARVNARTTARPGDEVVMAMDLTKLHIFDKDTEKVITN